MTASPVPMPHAVTPGAEQSSRRRTQTWHGTTTSSSSTLPRNSQLTTLSTEDRSRTIEQCFEKPAGRFRRQPECQRCQQNQNDECIEAGDDDAPLAHNQTPGPGRSISRKVDGLQCTVHS